MSDEYEHADSETVLRALKAFDVNAGMHTDDLWWRVDGVFAPITLFVNCNDLFYWACADEEVVGPSNIHILEQAVIDAKAVNGQKEAPLLFACRCRKMRPQKPYYKFFSPEMAQLFDACGPEREA